MDTFPTLTIRLGGKLALFPAAGVVLMGGEALAQGCAMCQTLFPSANEQVAQGMLRSAFFLMSMPFVVFGSIGGWIAYRYWKTRPSRQSDHIVRPHVPTEPVSKEDHP